MYYDTAMSISEIIQLFCGVSLFLFGMSLMGDGLKKVSGNKLEPILYHLSNTQPKAVILGTGVTAVIQSSCGRHCSYGSGLCQFRYDEGITGINVILGAILGTSITGWILCLSYIEGGGDLKTAALDIDPYRGCSRPAGILLRTAGESQNIKIILGISF